ncbi:hypothetical protein ZWY2020_051611 [Hordeum vulgare]|nr:hypothetical protein ZWY2020_051611 [Hordeum vulgare]
METGRRRCRQATRRRYKVLMPWRFSSAVENGQNTATGRQHRRRRRAAMSWRSVPDRSAKLPTIVLFYSLKDHGYVHSMKFRSACYSIRCSPRVVAVSRLERVVRLSLYCPDGTRKKLSESQQMDERRDWKRQVVQTLVDKYNDQHHLSGV